MNYDILTTNRDATALARDLKRCASIAWDTETFGDAPLSFDWIRGKQAWHQYSDGKRAWLVDCTKVNIQIFKPVLESPSVLKIIHSSAFDAAWTKREHKITVQNICDTRYQEQIILGVALPRQLKKEEKAKWEEQFSASLKFCFKRRGWDDKLVFEPFYEGVPLTPTQPLYMVRDVDQLHELMMDQQESINKMGLENVQILENNICEVIVEMMNNGFGVDERGWMKTTRKEEKIYDAAMKELRAIADINWNSWQQYCEFFGVHRTDDLNYYEANTEERLRAFDLFRKVRDHYKNVTTYGRSFIEQHVKDGLLRGQYTQMVNTARLSSDNPNLQNLPSKTEHRFHMIPGHYKNGVFVDADFSGQEMAIMAKGSEETSWLECLRNGGDLHSMVASQIITGWDQLDPAEKKRQRHMVKIINFSIAYGAGVDTIAQRANAEVSVIQTRLATMKRKYPKLFRWLTNNGAEAKRTWASYSFPPFNRYRNLAMESEGWRRVNIGKNNPVQMTAADMTKMAMYLVWQEIKHKGLPALFIHQLHDQLILECHTRNAKRVAKALVRCMNEACVTILGEALSNPEVKVTTNWDKRTD